MARGGGTGSRNKKKKSATDITSEKQDTLKNNTNGPQAEHAGDNQNNKHKNTKHRKQKEETPPTNHIHIKDEEEVKEEKQGKLVPTSEQLRLAQLTQSQDTNMDPQRKAKISQVMDITGKSEDEVATALFDCGWDETRAIELLFDESSGLGSWEETGKKKKKKQQDDKDNEKENEDWNDDFDPNNQFDSRERSRNRGPPRLRNRGGMGGHMGRGEDTWKNREFQENERNYDSGAGRGRGGRGMGPRSRGGGGVGMRQRGRGGGPGGPRGDRGHYNARSGDFSDMGDVRQSQQPESQGGFGQIDTWNPMGGSSETEGGGRAQKQGHQAQRGQNRQMNNSKDAFDNAGNWGDDFPPAEDWDNDEYTGSLTESKVFTPSGASSAAGKAVGDPVSGGAGGQLLAQQPQQATSPQQQLPTAANNSLSGSSYSQPIDISTLLQKPGGLAGAPSVAPGGPTASLSQFNQTATQDLKSAIGIPTASKVANEQIGYGSSFSAAASSAQGAQVAQPTGYAATTSSTQHNNSSFSSPAPGSAFSPIKPAAVTNGTSSSSKVPRARLPPPSRIPSSAVEMPGDSLSNLDVQFGGLDLQFGNNDTTSASNYDFSSAPGAPGSQVTATPPTSQKTANESLESKYAVHSIPAQQKPEQLPSAAPGSSPLDSYKAPGVAAPGSHSQVKDVNQSLSSALSAAGIKQSASSDNVPGFGRSEQNSRPDSKSAASYGVPGAGVPGQTQRSPGPLITKADTLGYNGPSYSYQPSNQSQAGKSTNYSSSGYPSSASSYERQNSSGYSSSNGLGASYGAGSGSGSSSTYNANSTAPGNFSNSGYNSVSQPGNNSSFGNSSYGSSSTATTNNYSPYTSNNSYSSKSSTPSTTYNPSAVTSASAVSLSGYPDSSSKTGGSSYENSVSSGNSSNAYSASGNSGSGSGLAASSTASSLGLSGSGSGSVSSSKMGGSGSGTQPPTTSTTGKIMPGGMPPGVASVLPAQYMIGGTAGGFPAYLAAGLGQAPAMYGYGGHQLEDLAALQRSTLAASLPQLVGQQPGNSQQPGVGVQANSQAGSANSAKGPSSGYYDPSSQFSGSSSASLGGSRQLGGVGVGSGVAGGQEQGQGFSTGSTQGQGAGQPQQQDNGQVQAKFGGVGGVASDSTSSPVPSTVAASGQQPPFSALASTFAAPAPQQHPTLPPGYAYFYGGVGGMPGALQAAYGGGVGAGVQGVQGVYPATHPGIPVNTAAGGTNTTQFQQNKPYGSSYGTSYDSLSLGQSNSAYGQKNSYGQNDSQGSKASSGNNTTGYWSSALW